MGPWGLRFSSRSSKRQPKGEGSIHRKSARGSIEGKDAPAGVPTAARAPPPTRCLNPDPTATRAEPKRIMQNGSNRAEANDAVEAPTGEEVTNGDESLVGTGFVLPSDPVTPTRDVSALDVNESTVTSGLSEQTKNLTTIASDRREAASLTTINAAEFGNRTEQLSGEERQHSDDGQREVSKLWAQGSATSSDSSRLRVEPPGNHVRGMCLEPVTNQSHLEEACPRVTTFSSSYSVPSTANELVNQILKLSIKVPLTDSIEAVRTTGATATKAALDGGTGVTPSPFRQCPLRKVLPLDISVGTRSPLPIDFIEIPYIRVNDQAPSCMVLQARSDTQPAETVDIVVMLDLRGLNSTLSTKRMIEGRGPMQISLGVRVGLGENLTEHVTLTKTFTLPDDPPVESALLAGATRWICFPWEMSSPEAREFIKALFRSPWWLIRYLLKHYHRNDDVNALPESSGPVGDRC